MTIRVKLPDGSYAVFPDGTDKEIIKDAIKKKVGTPVSKTASEQYNDKGFTEAVGKFLDGEVRVNPRTNEKIFIRPGSTAITDQAVIDEMMKTGSVEPIKQYNARQAMGATPDLAVGGQVTSTLGGLPFVGRWLDEAVGGMFGEEANKGFDQSADLFKEAYPGASLRNEIGGGLLGTALMAGAAGPQVIDKAIGTGSVFSQIVRGALSGMTASGIEGAVSGAGAADEGNRGVGALVGGTFGGILGGLLGGASSVGGMALKSIADAFNGRTLRKAAEAVGTVDDKVNVKAVEFLSDAMKADASSAPKYLGKAGDSAIIGGMGNSTRGIVNEISNVPGPAAATVYSNTVDAAENATRKLGTVLDETLGPVTMGPRQTTAEIMTNSANARKTAYDAAYNATIDYGSPLGTRLRGLIGRVDSGVIAKAEGLARRDGVEFSQEVIDGKKLPNVRQLDYITRATYDAGSSGGIGAAERLSWKNLTKELRKTLDELVPEYKIARDVAADPISEREAVQFGREMLKDNVTREDVALDLDGMSLSELSRVKQSVRSYIDDVIANSKPGLAKTDSEAAVTRDALKKMSSKASREKLAMLLGPDEADRVVMALDEAGVSYSTIPVLGSATEPRQVVRSRLNEVAGKSLEEKVNEYGALGLPTRAITQVFTSGGKTQTQRANDVRAFLADVMTDPKTTGKVTSAVKEFNKAKDAFDKAGDAARSIGRGVIGYSAFGTSPTLRPDPELPAKIERLSEMGYSDAEIVEAARNPAKLEEMLRRGAN